MSDKPICTCCGREGHTANNCPWAEHDKKLLAAEDFDFNKECLLRPYNSKADMLDAAALEAYRRQEEEAERSLFHWSP